MGDSRGFYIFASGNGSNAEKLLEHYFNLKSQGRVLAPCLGLVTNNENAGIIKRSEAFNISVLVIPSNGLEREEHENKILKQIETHKVWIFLAGYMKILSPKFLKRFKDNGFYRVVNIHPSLLPKYPGLRAYEKAYENNDKECGITIHLVDEGVDSGKILKQVTYQRDPSESFEVFQKRGLEVEHKIYPQVFEKIITSGMKDFV